MSAIGSESIGGAWARLSIQRGVRKYAYPRTCQQCASPYIAKKRHGRFCSDPRRAAAHAKSPSESDRARSIFRAVVGACQLSKMEMLAIIEQAGPESGVLHEVSATCSSSPVAASPPSNKPR